MPELPEVEVSRLGISPFLIGNDIKKIHVYQANLRWPVPEAVYLTEGLAITSIYRRAKYLLLETVMGSLILHLGMSGKLRVVDRTTPRIKHDHVDIELTTGKVLRLNDPRRFGAFLFQAPNETHPLLTKLGPEPLTEKFNANAIYQRSRGKQLAIKQFIMDNHVVVGVGNIYANEALFKAGIDPRRAAGNISLARYQKLVGHIKETLHQAIAQGGTTLKDFAQTDGRPGYFAQQLLVYGKAGQPCPQCFRELAEVRQNNRSSVYCRTCQK